MEKIIRCPICSKITALEGDHQTQKIEQVHGICWNKIWYSLGGWGRGREFISDFTGEVCHDCFSALKTKIDEFKDVFNQRKNSCEEGVCIYKTSKDQSKGDNVPDLQEDQLQPKRHKTSLLRLLSLFSR